MASSHALAIRRPGTCDGCGTPLDAGVRAWWDAERRVVRCLPCQEADGGQGILPPSSNVRFEDIDRGRPGGSARHRHDRLHPDAPLSAFQPRGRLATVVRSIGGERKYPSSYAKGEEGEVRVGARLERLIGDRAVLLHDRSVPGTKGNIDHLAIAPSGVWIIDAKHYRGALEVRPASRVGSGRRLFVGGRNQSRLLDGFGWQVDAVTVGLGGHPVPIHSALCFVEVDWPMFAKPYQLNDVWVIWAKELAKKIAAPGPLDRDHVELVSLKLATALPAKT